MLISTLDILNHHEHFKAVLESFSKWTFSYPELVEIFDEFLSDPDSNAVVLILRLTAILEFSLGNVYLKVKQQLPPHLLKDLLQELSDINDPFSSYEVFFY